MNEKTSLVLLRKFRMCFENVYFCISKSTRLHILGNNVDFSQNASYYIQNSFLLRCSRE